VVSGDDEDLSVARQSAPKLVHERFGRRHRPLRVAAHELHRVAKEDKPVDAGERLEQPLPDGGHAQDVAPSAVAQMQIGDDERTHGGAR
jgi:hypothetical protein